MTARDGHDTLPVAPARSAPVRLYLSGPMSDLPGNNYEAFNRAARVLRDMGYEVRNPAELDAPTGWALRDGVDEPRWEDWMRMALALMLQCDAVAMLPDWERSRRARVEHATAAAMGWACPTLREVLAGEIDGRGR